MWAWLWFYIDLHVMTSFQMNTTFKPKDYTGKKIGLLTALYRTETKSKCGSHIWALKCICGSVIFASSTRFTQKWPIYSCGCKKKVNTGRREAKDLSQYRNKMATAIEPTTKRQKDSGYVIWKLKCDCGVIFERPARMLIMGYTKSCGCTLFRKKLGRPRIQNNGAYVNSIMGHYRYSAKTRNLPFHLTKKEFKSLIEGHCFYCNEAPIDRKIKNLSGTYAWNGIDRLDSSIGYFKTNAVSSCAKCNLIKGSYHFDDFKIWIKKVHDNLLVRSLQIHSLEE